MTKPNSPRVLFVTRRFPPSVGGMENYAFALYSSLNQQADVQLIKWGGKNRYLALFMLPYFFVKSCWILLTKPIDIIHMQDGVLSVLGVVLKFIFRKPLTVVIHGLDITFENSLYQAIIPRALKKADHVFCISNAARDEVLKRGIDGQKASYHPIGMDDDIFMNNKKQARQFISEQTAIDSNTQVLLSVGRLVKRKGVEWFIANVLPELVKANKDIVFLVSGDGEARPEVEATIKKKHMEKYVRLLGRTSDEFRQNLYNGADIFVMPNVRVAGDMEGFGIVLLEAALCELPVVASGIEGIKDAVIDGKNGVLVPTKDKQAQVQAIKKFLQDPKAAFAFGKKSRKYTLQNYNWPAIASQYVDEYRKLVR